METYLTEMGPSSSLSFTAHTMTFTHRHVCTHQHTHLCMQVHTYAPHTPFSKQVWEHRIIKWNELTNRTRIYSKNKMNQQTRELISTPKTQQQRPELHTVIHTWHVSKCKLHKLQQRHILQSPSLISLTVSVDVKHHVYLLTSSNLRP